MTAFAIILGVNVIHRFWCGADRTALLVTGCATARCSLEYAIDMAGIAGNPGMSVFQRKPGAEMVKFGGRISSGRGCRYAQTDERQHGDKT